jgi:exodeoxyribonuclease VII large subunit
LTRAIDEKLATSKHRIESCLSNRVFTRPIDVIWGVGQQSLDQLEQRLRQAVYSMLEKAGNNFAVLAGRLNTLSPLATLSRGYSICTTPDETRVISDAASIQVGERLALLLHKGRIEMVVEKKDAT